MSFTLVPVGRVESVLKQRKGAPRQGVEGAPDAWVVVAEAYAEAVEGLGAGDEVVLLTWLHESNRDQLKTRPRNNPAAPLTGVFATRSPDRPNPIGLHRVNILAVDGLRLHVSPLEAIDGTPVVDIKPVLAVEDA
jgi:tRNA-Thr(GGU) m(6)t(6)A37 methyltransferase TsaA